MSSRKNNTTVLVVDDDKEVADLYQLQLQNRYDAKAVYGGEEALESIDETVDVVILDRRMPELSGDDVLQEIRNRGVGCRVVMVSAVYKESGESIPADGYYEKPLDRESLYEAVESQLDASNGSHKPE
jgi:two-component system response regulator VicR